MFCFVGLVVFVVLFQTGSLCSPRSLFFNPCLCFKKSVLILTDLLWVNTFSNLRLNVLISHIFPLLFSFPLVIVSVPCILNFIIYAKFFSLIWQLHGLNISVYSISSKYWGPLRWLAANKEAASDRLNDLTEVTGSVIIISPVIPTSAFFSFSYLSSTPIWSLNASWVFLLQLFLLQSIFRYHHIKQIKHRFHNNEAQESFQCCVIL